MNAVDALSSQELPVKSRIDHLMEDPGTLLAYHELYIFPQPGDAYSTKPVTKESTAVSLVRYCKYT